MQKPRFSLQFKFLVVIILIVSPVLGAIFIWTGIQNEKNAMEQVINQARVLSRQIILTRQWISDCGGIMVLENSRGARNTQCFFEDQMDTDKGRFLRFTPSMVTRKLSDYSYQQDLYRFRLASMNPINPANLPDAFERNALNRFKKVGLAEIYRFEDKAEDPFFQYIVPLYMESACLKCHTRQEVSHQGILGGLSVFLPLDKAKTAFKYNHLKLGLAGLGFIGLTIFILFFMLRRMVIRPLKTLEHATTEISSGNLDAEVTLRTGDEFENLGITFNTMAQKLARGRVTLEKRIDQATHKLSEANRELKTLDKLKSDFLANMSHELRSPLTVIRGGIDYLNRKIEIEDNRNYLSIIDKNVARLTRLVTDLFDFTKLEAKKIEWSFESEDLNRLIAEVLEIISPMAIDRNIAINFDSRGDIFVEMDLERIEQVLVNLIENAIKFSKRRKNIDIFTRQDHDSVTVGIKDYGEGIDTAYIDTIFEKFSTAPSGSHSQTEGTGLGLAICKAIVEAHGGRIWVVSEKGVFSTFYFSLPKTQAA